MKLSSATDWRNPAEYVSRKDAAKLVGVSVRWLESQTAIPKINLAGPGARRATWRYSRRDLIAFMENRKIGRNDSHAREG
jgi:hypothetical protein